MVIVPLLERHWGRQDKGSVASSSWTQTWIHQMNQPEHPGLMQTSFYTPLHPCKQYNSDIMIKMSWSSASLFRWEKPSHMHSSHANLPTCLQMSPTYSLTHPCTNQHVKFTSHFLCLWHSPPGILVHPNTRACNLLTLSMLHMTIVLLSHLVEKVPSQELFSAQRLAWVWYDRFSRWCQ